MTGIVVTYNTAEVFRRCYESVREFLPNLPLIIIDGSEVGTDCYKYVKSLTENKLNTAYQLGYNIGHGTGMNYGIQRCPTQYALIFDSDIVMLKNPVPEMLSLMEEDTYGVGYIYEVGRDGFDYGTYERHFAEKPIPYLHPYFHLLNVGQYRRFEPYCHHGAPAYKAMISIYEKGLSGRILKHFSGLTLHSTGKGINWEGQEPIYIRHDFGATRTNNKRRGLKEVPGAWQR